MMIEISGNELLPVATAMIKYASYKTTVSTPTPHSHQPDSHKRLSPEESTQNVNTIPHESRNTYDRPQQINKHEKPHRETTKPAQLGQDYQFQQIMHRRVDPPTSL